MNSQQSNRNPRLARLAAAALLGATTALPARAAEIERELHIIATVEAEQSWKNGEQFYKATSSQHYDLSTRLKSDGVLQVRNINDLDLNTRLEAKTIFLARQAKKQLERMGLKLHFPLSPADQQTLNNKMQDDIHGCGADMACYNASNARFAAIMAGIEHPEAMEDDTVPGTFQYFLAWPACPEKSRITMDMKIDGVRLFKSGVGHDSLIPYSEHRSADTVDGNDGLRLCDHFTATIDAHDKTRAMYLDNVYFPSPAGVTEYTEGGRTTRTNQSQPLIGPAVEWMAATLRHAAASGTASGTVPLPLALNGNSTSLGLFQGSAKVTMQWTFAEVPAVR